MSYLGKWQNQEQQIGQQHMQDDEMIV